ncbi:efflux RND transporter periplasmic adaptor subunit [Methylocystis sp. MJC1]|uniref:efflux RND transporter periplasmic adaptor subunit n=1 Tax=Methylocystis sp. MJC1 TaxID=2654282 RepID=UPI0013EAE113|nr:efflux RND transporter periplasmic adaptor subunit [Methylocystis sp. MJC1]KAF2992716.1 Solvent efflux pump periplasmic linker SrpA [Methylocystis sp. MJC1]MBU6526679.1 efflux RND transporter periplasmic adaptor subunit [Methylocystis sp. MJC1]UZX13118.1 efflux RND transporter periplasmic adaptor subunit [Methylocystis sp. MJC1]
MLTSTRTIAKDRLGSSLKPMLIMLASVGLVFAGLYGFITFRSIMIGRFLASMANPPQTVSVTTAKLEEWRPTLAAIGTFRAVSGADLALEASGVVEKILFKSGEDVAAGQILLELRKDTDNARLESLKATAELNEINLRRDQAQLKLKAVSQATVDSDLANLRSAKAEVAQQEAVIAQKTLRAPFAGRLGIRSVDVGQYMSAGTVVVTLQAIDILYLDFVLPQQNLNGLDVGQSVSAAIDAYPGQSFVGQITAINSKVDQASRNVQIRATFPNPDRKLRPGMFASVSISVGKSERLVTVPQTAIVHAPYGASVFLAQKNASGGEAANAEGGGLVARQSFVQLGATRGDEIAVVEGLKAGEVVVTAGQMKLRNDVPLKISSTPHPPVNPDPKPVDR